MRRFLALAAAMMVIGACASPFAKAETPEQALAAAANRSAQLHSAKFDLSGHVTLTFPPELAKSLQQSGLTSGNLTIDVSGPGEAQFPDRYRISIDAKMQGLSISSKVISVAGKTYVQNPLTQKWELSPSGASYSGGLNQPDPLSYNELLSSAKSVKDMGDTTLDGVDVHHYQLVPDKDKLAARLENSPSLKSAQAKAALKQILDSGSVLVEVWFGKDDHLVRQVTSDADYTVDLSELLAGLSGATGQTSKPSVPAGSKLHAVAHVSVHYHDFDKPVTITAPTVG